MLMTAVLGALAMVGLTAGTAAAADVLQAKIPFAFVVNGKSFPAGQYTIERAGMGSEPVFLIRNDSGKGRAAFVAARPVDRHSPPSEMPALQFTRRDNQYTLSAVWESADQGDALMN
jgi:hypothetical protein